MGGMDVNPYESPRVVGYRPPEAVVHDAKLRDRIALLVCAATIYAAIMAASLFVAWLKGAFS